MDGERDKNEVAVFGGGCFWCTEAIFSELRGVQSVMPGYAGGTATAAIPTYEAVSSGTTGHAEVIKIVFDPSQLSFHDLLTVFFATHDPTTPNRQGNDVGTQYRSIILYSNTAQKEAAEAFIKKLTEADPGGRPVITEIKPLGTFSPAENYHRDYFKNNRSQPYCQVIIEPKVRHLEKDFAELLATHGK